MPGQDHHAKVLIDLEDAYRGAQRSISLRMPTLDEQGRGVLQERTLDVNIPKGIREGQQLRLAGQGGPGFGEGAPAGDLFLEIAFNPHPRFRVDGRDVYVDLPLAPWEAALGGAVAAATPEGDVELTIPPGSAAGRKLRLKGRGIPGQPAGDLYVVLAIALPPASTDADKRAYAAFKSAFDFDPRASTSKG
jgi:curved DNA-binding protein